MLLIGHRLANESEPLAWHRLLTEGRHGVVTSCGLTPNPSWRVTLTTVHSRVTCARCKINLEQAARVVTANLDEQPRWSPPTRAEERL